MTLAILLIMSILMVWLMNKFQSTRELLKEACPINRHRSFILDLTLLLPLVGFLVEVVTRRIQNRKNPLFWWSVRQTLYTTAFGIFLAISGSLYMDYFNFSFLTPFLGHPEAWGGNHFMWNSGIEVLGLRPIVDTAIPTYKNFWGFWNLLAIILLGPIYILDMVWVGTWLHGLLLGYTEKQTGISALFFESRKK